MTRDAHHVILDTDIGSDVDDAMALAVLFGTPDVDLLGATTVYGDTLLRAQILLRYAALANRTVSTYVGAPTPLSSRDVWWAGIEGSLHDDLQSERPESTTAHDFLLREVTARPTGIDLVAIGPLTNIAAAIGATPQFAAGVRHLWIMGGIFDGGAGIDGTGIEHNFRSDAVAASRVFGAGIPTTVTGLEITERIEFGADHLARIKAAGELGGALSADIVQWWDHWKREKNTPHDPITVLTLTDPDLFEFSGPGRIEIVVDGDAAGRSSFIPDPHGCARLITDLDADAVAEAIVSRIEAASIRHIQPTGD